MKLKLNYPWLRPLMVLFLTILVLFEAQVGLAEGVDEDANSQEVGQVCGQVLNGETSLFEVVRFVDEVFGRRSPRNDIYEKRARSRYRVLRAPEIMVFEIIMEQVNQQFSEESNREEIRQKKVDALDASEKLHAQIDLEKKLPSWKLKFNTDGIVDSENSEAERKKQWEKHLKELLKKLGESTIETTKVIAKELEYLEKYRRARAKIFFELIEKYKIDPTPLVFLSQRGLNQRDLEGVNLDLVLVHLLIDDSLLLHPLTMIEISKFNRWDTYHFHLEKLFKERVEKVYQEKGDGVDFYETPEAKFVNSQNLDYGLYKGRFDESQRIFALRFLGLLLGGESEEVSVSALDFNMDRGLPDPFAKAHQSVIGSEDFFPGEWLD